MGAAQRKKHKAAKKATAQSQVNPEEERRRSCVNFQSVLLERVAKLEAMLLGVKQDKKTPVTNTDHMQAGEKDVAIKTLNELEKDVDAQLAVPCEKVDHFKTTYGVMISGVPSNYATAGDISRLVNDADIAYKAFFGKDSLQLPFYRRTSRLIEPRREECV